MQTRIWKIAGLAIGFTGLSFTAITASRRQHLEGDKIANPDQDPYLDFAEKQRQAGKHLFSPWTTSNQLDLALAKKHFPELAIPQASQLIKPEIRPVEIMPLSALDQEEGAPPILAHILRAGLYGWLPLQRPKEYQMDYSREPLFVAVGGPRAALAAYHEAKQGRQVLYVNQSQGFPEARSDMPASAARQERLHFFWNQLQYFAKPPRFAKEVLQPNFPCFNLNVTAWLRNPGQWHAGFRAAYHLVNPDAAVKAVGKESAIEAALRDKSDYLEEVNQDLAILRPPRGSLQVARTLQDQQAFKEQASSLIPIDEEKMRERYGFYPRASKDYMEKPDDFMLAPQFFDRIVQGIKAQGGRVASNWQLTRVLVDTDENQGGILEFCETQADGTRVHHQQQFAQTQLALGATPFSPQPYPLVSVTEVSINALVMGVSLKGGPIAFGVSAMTPLSYPKRVDVGNSAEREMDMTDLNFVRLTAGASLGPANRGENCYTYDGRHALHLLENTRTLLPRHARLKVLSVTGSHQVLAADGRQLAIHPELPVNGVKMPIERVTIQVGTLLPARVLGNNSSGFFFPKPSVEKKTEPDAKLDGRQNAGKYFARR